MSATSPDLAATPDAGVGLEAWNVRLRLRLRRGPRADSVLVAAAALALLAVLWRAPGVARNSVCLANRFEPPDAVVGGVFV